MKSRKVFGLVLATALSLAGASMALAAAREASPLERVERPLPEFDHVDLEGRHWTPESLAGKVWIINLWASWCPPCVEEMPSMNAAREQLDPAQVGMLALNAGESRETIEAFLEKLSLDFPVLLGDSEVMSKLSVQGLPTTVVVNRQGMVVYEAIGPRDWSAPDILAMVTALTNEP